MLEDEGEVVPIHQQQPSESDANTSPDPDPDPRIAAIQRLLGCRITCTMDDGRSATGTFICMDRLKNIILLDVLEERLIRASDYYPTSSVSPKKDVVSVARRELTQAMIPGKHLVRVTMSKAAFEERQSVKSSMAQANAALVAQLEATGRHAAC